MNRKLSYDLPVLLRSIFVLLIYWKIYSLGILYVNKGLCIFFLNMFTLHFPVTNSDYENKAEFQKNFGILPLILMLVLYILFWPVIIIYGVIKASVNFIKSLYNLTSFNSK